MNLRGVTWDHPRGYDCLVAASAQYTADTGVIINWTKRSLQAFADTPIVDLARDNDFVVLDHPHVGQIAKTGGLLALPEPDDPGASLGGSAESYCWHGRYWAHAIDAACQVAVRRPDMDAPVPAYREDFLDSEARAYRPLTPLLPVDAFDMLMTLVASRGEHDLPSSPDRFVSEKTGFMRWPSCARCIVWDRRTRST